MILIILKTILCSFLFLGIYYLILNKTALHRLKRFYLLFALFASLAIPFIQIEAPLKSTEFVTSAEAITQPIIDVIDNFGAHPGENNLNSAPLEVKESERLQSSVPTQNPAIYTSKTLAITSYALITMILLFRLVRNVLRLVRKIRQSEHTYYKDSKVVLLSEPIAPFSFLNYAFIAKADFDTKESIGQLLTHEIGHIKQKHTIDILILEVLKVMLWFNPFYHFYGKAIRQNHEFLADVEVLKVYQNVADYQKLLFHFINRSNSNSLTLVSPFNNSPTQKRFIMMTQKNSRKTAIVRLAILVPLLAITTMSFTFKTTDIPMVNESSSRSLDNSITENVKSGKPEIAPVDLVGDTKIVVNHGTTLHRGTDRMYDHDGVDFRAKLGTPVKAAGNGTVELVSKGNPTYGNYIRLRHGDQYQTVYASLKDINVEKGQTVKKGQVIGSVGKSIPDSNIHLHYEVIKNGNQVDPDEYFFHNIADSFVLMHNKMTQDIAGFKYRKENNMALRTRAIHFSKASKYAHIMYDQTKIIFVTHDGVVSKTQKLSDLSDEQMQALKKLRNGASNYTKTRPSQEIVSKWTNPDNYMITINGNLVKSESMSQYNADDFAYFLSTKLRNNDPEKPISRLNLFTNAYFDELVEEELKITKSLISKNNDLINILDQ